MGKECCKSNLPCKDCPKLKKKHRKCGGGLAAAVHATIRPIFTIPA